MTKVDKKDLLKKFHAVVDHSKDEFNSESRKLLASLEKKRLVNLRKDLGI